MDTNLEKRAVAEVGRAMVGAGAGENRVPAPGRVLRLLVTGAESPRVEFFIVLAGVVNAIEGREETVLFTCMQDGLERVKIAAGALGLTLEEVLSSNGGSHYRVLVKGSHPGWGEKHRRPSRRARRAAAQAAARAARRGR